MELGEIENSINDDGDDDVDTNLKLYSYYIDDVNFAQGKYNFQARLNNQIYDSIELNFRKKYMFTPAKSIKKEFHLGILAKSLIDISIGKGTYGVKHLHLSAYTEDALRWEINIGAFVSIAPNTKIVLGRNSYHDYKTVTTYPFQYISSMINDYKGLTDWYTEGKENDDHNYFHNNVNTASASSSADRPKKSAFSVNIGNDVWIGEGSILINDISIGDGAVIGAYSVVRENVPPYAIVMGNPAKIIKYRFSTSIISELLELKWWTWEDDILLHGNPFTQRFSTEIEKEEEMSMHNNNNNTNDIDNQYDEDSFNKESIAIKEIFSSITKYGRNLESFVQENKA